MSKIQVEVCMMSARGLRRRRSTFLKPQWFAVGWVDPDEKYCTRIDASGTTNPTWKTKFSFAVGDATSSGEVAAALTVEVYKREPIFLSEKLHGVAVVPLKEFMIRFLSQTESNPIVDSGSFQLRKKNSGESRGFVDVSIHIYRKSEQNYHRTIDGDFPYANEKDGITIAIGDGPTLPFPAHPQPPHRRLPTPPPPPPPPPSNAGFLPSLFPGAAAPSPETYASLPPQGAARHGGGEPSGFGIGLGAGALAAGAMIFGDDFMSGSAFPAGLHPGSLTVSADGDALF